MGQLEDWWFNRVSRLGRLINRVNEEKFTPMPQPRRHYFTSLLWISLAGAAAVYFMDQYIWWYPSWLGLWPMWGAFVYLTFSFGGYLLLERWTESAPKCIPGMLDVFTMTDEGRHLRPITYVDEKQRGTVVVYQMAQLGGLVGNWWKGNYVLISPILEDDISNSLTDAYNGVVRDESGKVIREDKSMSTYHRDPKLPEDRFMSFGRKWGDMFYVPGDLEYYVMGNTEDALEEEFRQWIRDVYPNWNDRTVIFFASDVLLKRKDEILDMQPVTHDSGLRARLRNAVRESGYWKGRYEEIVRQGSKVNRIAKRGSPGHQALQEMFQQ